MVININKPRAIYYPKAVRQIEELEKNIEYVMKNNGYEERIIFPHIHSLDLFDMYYSDIKKEYLVTTFTAEEKVFVLNPEYRTVIKHYANTQFSSVTDYPFYYKQNAYYYTSIEAKEIKEDLLIGAAILNPINVEKAWQTMLKTIAFCMRAAVGSTGWAIAPKMDYSLDIFYKDNLVGYCKKEENSISFHISIKDLYNLQ